MNRPRKGLAWLFVVVAMTLSLSPAMGDGPPQARQQSSEMTGSANDVAVMEAFNRQKVELGEAVRIDVERKHQILFFMGIALLVLVVLTAAYGVAMAIYGKPVFVRHMVLAGLSVTLAIAHAIVAIVWFFPF